MGVLSTAIAGKYSDVHHTDPRLPAVLVVRSDSGVRTVDTEITASAYVASMSTGMPMWPALLLAEEGSLRFAATGLAPATLRVSPEH
jgi:hypothetical protein